MSQGGIAYLSKANVDLDAIFNIDNAQSKYTLKDNELQVNALKLNADGYVQLQGDDVAMDLAVTTPQNEFKHLLSLIPNAYIEGYEAVKADGQFNLDATIKGLYSEAKNSLPAVIANLKVDNANVQYPDLPLGITNINTAVNVNSPGSDFDQLKLDVPRFSIKVGNNPFEAVFKLRTPISDPDIDTKINGVLNLEELAKAFPIEDMETLNGIITANLTAKTKMSYIDQQDYEKVDMAGDFQVQQVNYQKQRFAKYQCKRHAVELYSSKCSLEKL